MPKDIDEDLIEATIRRVQAQADAEPEDADSPSDTSADEDAIEATIRRVQQQAAANATPAEDASVVGDHGSTAEVSADRESPSGDDDEDPIAATIRRVQEQVARSHAASNGAGLDDAPSASTPPPIEVEPATSADDSITETIRRVQAQAAARSHSESSDFAPTPLPVLDDDEVDEYEEPVQLDEPVAPAVAEREIEETSWPGRDERLLGEPASWEVAAQRLEQGLQDNSRQVQELAARLDALLPALNRLLEGSGGAPALAVVPRPEPDDEAWDEPPVVSRVDFGGPPRPAVLRDPAPHSAAARKLEEVPEESGAHLRAIADGSMDDRLPRQYRITVEDKRRGVDLVPLHRAMQSLQNVRDMSLLSYNNGVAIVLIETTGALDPETLREAVGRAMARETKIEVHNESTMVVKVQED